MKLVLHYLKFDFLRWRWLVFSLWWLVAMHCGLIPALEVNEMLPWRWRHEIVPLLSQAVMIWAALLVAVVAGSDSPVRRRTWLLTRAGGRRAWIAARLTFVLLALVLPLAIDFALVQMVVGGDALTGLLCFWLALKYVAPLAAALWLWVRAWPHLAGLIVGSLGTLSLGLMSSAFGLQLPVEWFAIQPSLLVLVCCLTLPAMVCLRAGGMHGRKPFMHGWIAGLLLPVMWMAGGAVSHGLRVLFPGPMERAVFGRSGEEWVLRVAGEGKSPAEATFDSEVPFIEPYRDVLPSTPVVSQVRILAASWQHVGTSEWSGWRPASGMIRRGIILRDSLKLDARANSAAARNSREKGNISLDSFVFDTEGLHGENQLRFRLKTIVSLEQRREHIADYYQWDAFMRGALISIELSNSREKCVRQVRLEPLRVVIREPGPTPSPVLPRAPRLPRELDTEPFAGYKHSEVWPPRSEMKVPDAGSTPHEATYFIHWLKGQKKLPEKERIPPFVAAWWAPCLEIALLEPLKPGNALLQALAAGLPEERRGEVVKRLRTARGLAPVIEQRGWQGEAKPVMLEMLRAANHLPDELMSLCRSYRDPIFHDAMRKNFTLDLPTVLYWESMPDLAEELPAQLDHARRGFRWDWDQCEALLAGGQPTLLRDLLWRLKQTGWQRNKAAAFLERCVLDADGHPPPSTGLARREDGQLRYFQQHPISPEFLQWFAGLTADDFTVDRAKRRFVRKSADPKAP